MFRAFCRWVGGWKRINPFLKFSEVMLRKQGWRGETAVILPHATELKSDWKACGFGGCCQDRCRKLPPGC